MFNWIRNKQQPKYWKDYQASCKEKQATSIETTRFVVFDTETTGLDIKKDRLLSIGAVGVKKNTIAISDSFEIYVKQSIFNPKTVAIHGILKKGNYEKHSEKKALKYFIKYLSNSVIVAHHAAFDVAMINQALKRQGLSKLRNKVIDTGNLYKKLEKVEKNKQYSLDRLCNILKVSKHDRHTASGDAFITALLFLKILARLKKERKVHLSDLFNRNRSGLL